MFKLLKSNKYIIFSIHEGKSYFQYFCKPAYFPVISGFDF